MPSREVELEGLGVESKSNTPVLLLRDPTTDRRIPLWLTEPEAELISALMDGEQPDRPLIHDLMLELMQQVGFELEWIEISALEEGVAHAELRLRRNDELLTLDARPADAMALALRTECPIRVDEEVLAALLAQDPPVTEEEKWTELANSLTPEDFDKFKQ